MWGNGLICTCFYNASLGNQIISGQLRHHLYLCLSCISNVFSWALVFRFRYLFSCCILLCVYNTKAMWSNASQTTSVSGLSQCFLNASWSFTHISCCPLVIQSPKMHFNTNCKQGQLLLFSLLMSHVQCIRWNLCYWTASSCES